MRIAIVGLGKMGLSHLAIFNAHPGVNVVAVCDSSAYVLSVLGRHTQVQTYSSYESLLSELELDGVVIATPSRHHAGMVSAALERGLHVFCEKPFTLDPSESDRLTAMAEERGLVTHVGYHNRFVGSFREVRRLLDQGAIGDVTHALGEAYGPVVLKPKGTTWRNQRREGGGCLYDYAAHPIDLLNWFLGEPTRVRGSVLNRVFSRETDDEVFTTLSYGNRLSAQVSVSWSDESVRKMTTRVNLWGTAGRIYADRQECQVFLRDTAVAPSGYSPGWNVKYTTELSAQVDYYLRGEEYTAQVDDFVARATSSNEGGICDFRSAAACDRVIAKIITDAAAPDTPSNETVMTPTSGHRLRERPRLRKLRLTYDRLVGDGGRGADR